MANGWTPERKARQAELIRNWRPWERSTRSLTDEGKARASRNGDKGVKWKVERDEVRALRALMRELLEQQRELLQRQ